MIDRPDAQDERRQTSLATARDALVGEGGMATRPASVPAEDFGFGGPATPTAAGRSPLQVLWRMLSYRWTIVLPALLVPAIAVPLVWTLLRPEYRASAAVRVSPVINRVVFKTDENGMVPLYNSYLNTQVSMILSPTVLNRVVDRQRHPDVAATTWFQDEGGSLFEAALDPLHRLHKGLHVAPRAKTELIDVSMSATDPREAQLLVNTVIGEYEIYHRDAAAESGQLTFGTLTKEINQLKRDLDAELNLKASVSKELGTNEPEELRAQLSLRLSDLEADWKRLKREQELAQWELEQVRGRQESGQPPSESDSEEETTGDDAEETEVVADGGDATAPAASLFADAEWRRLREALDQAEHQLAAGQERYGEAHPKLKQLAADVEFARGRLGQREEALRDGGGGTVAAGAGGGPEVAIEHQNARSTVQATLLQRDIEAQRQEVRRAGELAEELSRREEEIKRKRALYDSIQARIDELDMESKNPLGRVTTQQAILPAEPSTDRRMMLSVVALLAGLGLGVGVAFLRAGLDTALRHADDLPATVTVPFLGQLPFIAAGDILDEGDETLLESLRMVRTALLERLPGSGRTVLITSPTAQAGKTTLTSLLGRSLASLGKRVLLVDADLRRACLTERLAPNQERGLTTVLHGKARWESVVVRVDRVGCDLLAAGKALSNHDPELMAGDAFAECMERWKAKYDYVLIDTTPVLPVADARMLAGMVDGTILTLRASHSRRADASETLTLLRAAGARLLGSVLVGTKPRRSGYGGYGYGYGYGRRSVELVETTARPGGRNQIV